MVSDNTMKEKQLKVTDRCDRCNAQAYVKAVGVNGALLFCNHHFVKWEDNIRKFAFEIVDERPNAQPEHNLPPYEAMDEYNEEDTEKE